MPWRELGALRGVAGGHGAQAIREMHRPTTGALQQEARRRLAFEELFLLQLTLLLKRTLARWEPRPPRAAAAVDSRRASSRLPHDPPAVGLYTWSDLR